MNTLVLASRNKDKIQELREILKPIGIELQSSYDFSDLEEVIEDRDTLEGNALKKARYTAETTGLPSVADDTGLEVDALNGAPGVYSARYAGDNATYQDNVEKLLAEMEEVPEAKRTARFRTVVAFVDDDREKTFHGTCEGSILTKPKGEGGFGYDPVFKPGSHQRTFAQLDPDEKNRISHRGRAIRKFVDWIS